MRLVHDDGVVAPQLRIRAELGEQQAIRHQHQACIGGHVVRESHPETDGAPDGLGDLLGDARGQGTRRQPAGLSMRDQTARPGPGPRPSSRQYFGSCVLFPEPVSPATIRTWWRSRASRMSCAAGKDGQIGIMLENQRHRRCATGASFGTFDVQPQRFLRREAQARECLARARRPAPPWPGSAARISRSRRAARPRRRHRACAPGWPPRTRDRRSPRKFPARDRRPAAAGRRGGRRFTHFGELLGHFVGGLARMLEIEAHPCRPLAQFVGAHERRQRSRHAIERLARPDGRGASPSAAGARRHGAPRP